MSFANEVKKEIARIEVSSRHCLLAESAAIFLGCGQVTEETGRVCLKLETDQYLVAKRFFYLIEEAFACRMQIIVRIRHCASHKRYELLLYGREQIERMLQAWKCTSASIPCDERDPVLSQVLLMSTCCRRAFLRGMFLVCGTMSTPEKNYHLEFVCNGPAQAGQLVSLMKFFSLEPKTVWRKGNQIVYIKEGRQVADMLNILQATVSLLEYENIRIKREIRGNINRKVNCEAANISKTVAAAMDQIRDIELIEQTVGLNSLSPELFETARMRLQYTDMALRELGAMMNPPVGKSGMNHRFHKLKKMADEIRANKEE